MSAAARPPRRNDVRAAIALSLLSSLATPLYADETADETIVRRAPSPELAAWSVNAAYFGEMVLHPGAIVGAERALTHGARRYGLATHGLFAEADVGSYWHARNSAAFFVLPQLGYRLVFPHGFRLEALVGAGYLRTFADGTVYEVSGAGQVRTVDDAGHPALMVSAQLGIGWDFTVDDHGPLSVFVRFGSFGQYPYNTAVLP